ncbi:cation/multidrug efflux pump [Sphaerochaeta pleomorpha str. Grapes]|uniref:Cation/multidrug efflux pump n=1 Tax=Sphaerochaeta pleomorpha (strain ATCC BAA-1885 / DSM 22778 / Grapes) TaxID=158190 RepID=G8QSE8_SPHPG|nr:efflux RND transporter permease subunit [Sphaerochaeta pleomorpha]AEV30078.1 cation/multidrug efflux pump [Sphaerochaeta pleomorpha str. Grapes]
MSPSKSAVKHPTTVLIIFVLLTALGIYSIQKLPIDLFPDMDIPYILVQTTYTNASPSEVEDKLTRTLENALSGVSGLKKLSSTSSEGSSTIILEFNMGTDLSEAANTIRDRFDLVRNYLPSEAFSPMILKLDPTMMPIMTLALTSDSLSPEELRKIADSTVQPRLEQIDGVASTTLSGGRERAIRVEIQKDKLKSYNLTISQVSQMIAIQNLQTSVGQIDEDGLDWSIAANGEYTSLDDLRNTVISYKVGSDAEAKRILLGDIALVSDSYKDVASYAYFDGVPSVTISIQKQTGKNTVTTANAVRKQMATIQNVLPAHTKLSEAFNTSDVVEQAVDQVVNSALQGALLAVLVLLIFLRSFKSTLIVGLSIPISLAITLGVMYFSGFSLNLMTLAGLALGVGMLVDNSIVILENIYSYRENGTKPTVAAILGSQEMLTAIVSSTLTTICVFLPMIMYKKQLGMAGQVFNSLAFTVVISLLCSLFVAVTLVPVLASKYLKLGNIQKRNSKGIQKKISSVFEALDNSYAKMVRFVLHHKVFTLLFIVALLGVSIMQITRVGFIYMPENEQNSVSVNIELPQGTNLDVTNDVLQQFNALALESLEGVKMSVSSSGGGSNPMASSGGANTASARYTLYSSNERQEGWDNDASARKKLEQLFNLFPEAKFTIESSSLTSSLGGGGLDISIKSNDLELCRETSLAIKQLLTNEAGSLVKDVESSLNDGLPQLTIVYDRERMYALGLNIASVNSELQSAIKGATVTRYRENGDEVDVIVGLRAEDKSQIADLDEITVSNSSGMKISLSNFAHYERSKAPVSITREDQSRIVHVTAKLQEGQTVDKVQKEVEKMVAANIPSDNDLILSYGGDYQQLMEGLRTFAEIIIIAILLVFAVMASQFESFLKPFIIIFSIPLSIIGIVAIYMITGQTFSLITAVGLLILVGIIVNNGIVLVSYTDLLQKRGFSLEEACVQAAKSRLRPILMTTLTTILALVPMAFFPGEGSEMVQPIGQTVLGGLGFGTLMTLFLMPTLYYVFNRGSEKRMHKKMEKEVERLSDSQQL